MLLLFVVILFSGVVLQPTTVFADTDSNIVVQIRDKFHKKAQDYGDKLKKVALGLFILCILVDVAWFGVKVALNRSEISETIKEFLLMIIFASFCFCAIVYYQDWTHYMLDKTESISSSIGGASLMLSPIDLGFKIVKDILKLIEEASWREWGNIFGYLLTACIILLCFSLMTARLLLILCESYIAMNVAILLLGFGGSGMTKDYAINTMRYVLSVAFKFLTTQLIMGVGLSFIADFQVIKKMGLEDLFILVSCAVILLAIIQTLPETVAGIINGSHMGGGVGLKAAAAATVGAAAGAFAGAVAKGTHAAQTVSAAHKIATLEGHQAGGGGGQGSDSAKNAGGGTGGSGGNARSVSNGTGGSGGNVGNVSGEMSGYGGNSTGNTGDSGGRTSDVGEEGNASARESNEMRESGSGTGNVGSSASKTGESGGNAGNAGRSDKSKPGRSDKSSGRISRAVSHMGRMGRAIYNANQEARRQMNMHSTQLKRTKAMIQEKVDPILDKKALQQSLQNEDDNKSNENKKQDKK